MRLDLRPRRGHEVATLWQYDRSRVFRASNWNPLSCDGALLQTMSSASLESSVRPGSTAGSQSCCGQNPAQSAPSALRAPHPQPRARLQALKSEAHPFTPGRPLQLQHLSVSLSSAQMVQFSQCRACHRRPQRKTKPQHRSASAACRERRPWCSRLCSSRTALFVGHWRSSSWCSAVGQCPSAWPGAQSASRGPRRALPTRLRLPPQRLRLPPQRLRPPTRAEPRQRTLPARPLHQSWTRP
jgi:hypothetical protein